MRKIIVILLCAFLCAPVFAQKRAAKPVTEPNRFEGLDTSFERILKDWHVAGIAVAVVEKDKVIWSKGFGYRDYARKLPVTPNTLFAIGSCTKAFTSTLMGVLQAAGKIDYDNPARSYIPKLRFFNDEMNNSITVRDLMCHRTGLPRYDFSWYAFPSSSRDSLMKRIQYMEPTARVREKWQYNNFMFFLQGLIAEQVTGQSWEKNIKADILNPLGMTSTNLSIRDLEKSSDASLGYVVKSDSIIKKIDYFEMDAMGPCGSINSNVTDLAKWVSAWVNGGKSGAAQVIPRNYVREAMSPQMVIPGGLPTKEKPDIQFSNYGFGWILNSYKGHYRVAHGGNIDGFSADITFFPTDSIGIVVLTNQNGSLVPNLVSNLIADRLLKLPYFDWGADIKKTTNQMNAAAKEMRKSATSEHRANTSPSHPLKDYEGIYSSPAYGSFDISVSNDSLFAAVANTKLWLRHYHYDVFEPFEKKPGEPIDTAERSPARFQFHMDESGDIVSMSQPLEPTLAVPAKFNKTPRPKAIGKDELQKYVGDYDLAGGIVRVYVKDGNTLYVVVPGQPDYELIPVETYTFALKVLPSFKVQFDVNAAGESNGITFIQPNGTFKGTRKK